MSPHADNDPTVPNLAQIEQLRVRAADAEQLAAVRQASLEEIAGFAEDLRIQVADFIDDANTLFRAKPYPPKGLRYVTERMNLLADTMARVTAGYTHARSEDMEYPQIIDDLAAHGWVSRPDRELDGALPPVPLDELGNAHGYRRGFTRGSETLTLWFTGPEYLAYANSSTRCTLRTAADIRAAISD
ncbi:hypothetical protein GCM10009565_48070 [Amycolatopsis albidoflavus]